MKVATTRGSQGEAGLVPQLRRHPCSKAIYDDAGDAKTRTHKHTHTHTHTHTHRHKQTHYMVKLMVLLRDTF